MLMVAWYKHDIPAWMDGTEALDDGQYRVYHVVCQLIYLSEGPIALNEHGIAGRCHQHILSFRKNLKTLLDCGKLVLIDGRLSNNRASAELQLVHNHRATSAKGGRGSSGVAKRSGRGSDEVDTRSHVGSTDNLLEYKESVSSPLLQVQHQEKRREEKREVYCTVAKATRTKEPYSEEFETKFWLPYPRSPTMAKIEAWKSWLKLSPEDRLKACQAIDLYRRYLKSKPDLETVHACRFLSQRRFEGFSDAPTPTQIFDIRSHLA